MNIEEVFLYGIYSETRAKGEIKKEDLRLLLTDYLTVRKTA